MAKKKDEKTNVMRILDQKKIPYTPHFYEEEEGPEGTRDYGVHVAQALGQDPKRAFKTLVAKGASGTCHVFDIPTTDSGGQPGPEKGGEGGGGEIHRPSAGEGYHRRNGVHPGRMQPGGHEEAVSHHFPPDGPGV